MFNFFFFWFMFFFIVKFFFLLVGRRCGWDRRCVWGALCFLGGGGFVGGVVHFAAVFVGFVCGFFCFLVVAPGGKGSENL